MSRRETVMKAIEEQREFTNARTKHSIELYRMGDATLTFVSDGELPEGITVEAEQVSHEFKFGANLFMLDELETDEKNVVYREKFAELFNIATLPFYWNVIDGYAHGTKPGDMTGGENKYHGALWRFDMSEKPAYKVLRELIKNEWHTSLTKKAENGRVTFRGFYGDYKLTVHAGGKTIPVDYRIGKGMNNKLEVRI